MGDKVDPKSIKKTQDILGKIIKKPPLTDKLLSKPPFRFLHDVCTSVIKNTGTMKGLFTDSEMSSENVKDKESKVAFLQKAIDFVSLVTGKALSAKPSKIVAGHEPDKTNDFLQAIAEAVNKKVDNDDYVRRVLTGDTKAPPEKSKTKDRERSADRSKKERDGNKSKDENRERSKDRDREKDREKEKDRDRRRDRKEREGSRDREKREKDKDEDRKHRDRDDDRKHRDKGDDRKHRDRDEDRKRDRDSEDRHKDREERHRDRDRRKKKDDEDKENQEADSNQMNGEAEAESEDIPARIPRPSSAKGSRRRQAGYLQDEDGNQSGQVNGHVGEDDLPPQVAASRRMARPSSARPAPPRVKKNEQAPEEPVIVGSSNVPNIITDEGDSDDDDLFVTKDDEEPQAEPEPTVGRRQASDSEDDETGDHGGLVKKMLDTKAQLEHGSQTKEAQVTKKTEIERSSQVSDVQRRKEREMVKKEIEKLRGSIQTLTRSVNPLGKILDFVQEDMDSMQKELDMWKKENRENQVALQREQSITDNSVEPLQKHLGELDNAIKDQLDLIAAVKSNILKNDDKISKMLSSITKS